MFRRSMLVLGTAALAALLTVSSVLAAPPAPGARGPKVTPPVAGATGPKATPQVPGANRHAYFGVVYSVAAGSLATGSFTLNTKQGETVTVLVTAQTRFHIPTLKNASLADLAAGDRVAVSGTPGADDLTAKNVAVAPGKPAVQHRVGIVTDYTADKSITIEDVKGGKETFTLTADTVIRGPKGVTTVGVDDRVTVVARRQPATDVFTAMAIVVHPNPQTS